MLIREIRPEEQKQFNEIASHPLQTWQWGEFREKTGIEVVRLGMFDGSNLKAGYQITIHPLPKLPFSVAYMPKCPMPTENVVNALKELGTRKQIIYIKVEPNVYTQAQYYQQTPNIKKCEQEFSKMGFVKGRALFTKHSFVLDLKLTDQELLSKMKSKTRYNLNIAMKKGVVVSEDNSDAAFADYLKLTFETTKRQGFYAHNKEYHQTMWETLKPSGMVHLLKAVYQGETLVSWILFVCNGVLYYPYGASSSKNRNVMASNLMMWEVIKFGKKIGCHKFDMWGSLGPNPNPHDSWIGFHRFKEGFSPDLMEFLGSYDIVINQPMYKLYNIADNLRWKYLKLRAKLPF